MGKLRLWEVKCYWMSQGCRPEALIQHSYVLPQCFTTSLSCLLCNNVTTNNVDWILPWNHQGKCTASFYPSSPYFLQAEAGGGDWSHSIIFVQIDLTVFRSRWSTKIGLNPQNSISEFYLQIYGSHFGSQADTGAKQMTPELAQSRPKLGVDVGNSQAGCRMAIIFQLIFSFRFLSCSR